MGKKLECFSCGQMSMVLKKGTSKLEDGTSIKNITRWVCENCGEELFDLKAMKKIRTDKKSKTVRV